MQLSEGVSRWVTLACGPGLELSKSNSDMASRLFTFTCECERSYPQAATCSRRPTYDSGVAHGVLQLSPTCSVVMIQKRWRRRLWLLHGAAPSGRNGVSGGNGVCVSEWSIARAAEASGVCER